MEMIRKFIKENKHLYLILYYFVIYGLYKIFNNTLVPEYYMHSFIDDYIPFVKQMVIPYTLWYFYIIFALIYFGFFESQSFIDLCMFMFMGMTICFIIFAMFPNGQNLRPNIEVTDFFTRTINKIYIADNPTNSLPSMHVLNAIAVHCAVIKSKKLSKVKWIAPISLVLMILISASTVFVKQHSILDAFAGAILAFTMYVLIYKLNIAHNIKEKMTLKSSKSVEY